MKITYKNRRVQKVCTDEKESRKVLQDGSSVPYLHSRIQLIEAADNLHDLFQTPGLNLHVLKGDRKGIWAMDVKNRKSPWRLLLVPLDENESPVTGGDVLARAKYIRIIEVEEVSRHYE